MGIILILLLFSAVYLPVEQRSVKKELQNRIIDNLLAADPKCGLKIISCICLDSQGPPKLVKLDYKDFSTENQTVKNITCEGFSDPIAACANSTCLYVKEATMLDFYETVQQYHLENKYRTKKIPVTEEDLDDSVYPIISFHQPLDSNYSIEVTPMDDARFLPEDFDDFLKYKLEDSGMKRSVDNEIGDIPTQGCKVKGLTTARMTCYSTPRYKRCEPHCLENFTYVVNGVSIKSRSFVCSFEKDEWITPIEECKPTNSCMIHLVNAGKSSCTSPRETELPVCTVSCYDFAHNVTLSPQTSKCFKTGHKQYKFDPPLPSCAEIEPLREKPQ